MKKLLVMALTLVASRLALHAQVPVASYRWNFNQTNVYSTNYIFPTITDGTVPVPPASPQGMLRELDGGGVSVNELGVDGSGVSSGTFPNIPHDRALLIPGVYGVNSYIVRTPDAGYALTNWPDNGVLTKFTITCWAKSEGAQGAFPRIVMFGPNGQDAGSAGNNCFGLLFFNNGDLQLKIHNASNPNSFGNGMSTTGQPLASAATNWTFIAVTYDGTLPSGGAPETGTNTIFYFGNRTDSLLSPTLAPGVTIIPTNYYAVSINSVAPGATDSPGYINFSPTALNGDGSTGVSNVFVAIGNRYNGTGAGAGGGNRAFNGRYDDIRLFANQVLTPAEVDAVRTNAPPGIAGPITIVQQPANTTVSEGQGAAFTVVASEAPNRTYQWYKIPKGVGTVSNAILNATSATLETTNLTVAGNNGDKYMVIVHTTDPGADNGGAGAKSVYATATVLATNLYTVTPGMLKFEYFLSDLGSSVDNFLAAPSANYTNNTPDLTLFLSSFDTRTVFPDNSHVGYFARITGWITPTVTTNYVFLLRGGDEAQLWLSTDGGLTTNRIAADFRAGAQVFYGPETLGAVPGTEFSMPIPLVAGISYPVVAYLKASSGQNLLQVAWRMDSGTGSGDLPVNEQNLADRLTPLPGSSLSSFDLPLGTVSITQQPAASPSSTVTANSKVTFSIGVNTTTNTGSGPRVIQWRKNGVNIAGATGASYTTPYLTAADSGASYSAVVSMPGISTTSSPVSVTVNPDNIAPTVVSASADDSMKTVTVQFSEPMDATTALNPARYSINGGALAVTGVAWAADTNLVDVPVYDAVKLSTAYQSDNTAYSVAVTGVKDTAANSMAGGNSASFRSYALVPGLGKFEYFEDQTYSPSLIPLDDLTANGLVSYSPKFLNNDPDTIVYPRTLAMAPEGQPTLRNGAGGLGEFPTYLFGTRLSAIITPTNTGNYVFYLAADDTAILWLSTDADPANKHIIARTVTPAGFSTQWSSMTSASTDTNTLMSGITIPGASPWPAVDGANIPVITLTSGQHYYLEVDHRESTGFASFVALNWDNATGVAPTDGSASFLRGSVIGWKLPLPQISSFAKVAGNVNISWTNGLGLVNLGTVPWPGIIAPATAPSIVPSFPAVSLQSTPSLAPASWTNLTNTSPASIPATDPMQFFRVNEQ